MRETWFGVLTSFADNPIIQIGVALIIGSFLILGVLHGFKLILGLAINIVRSVKAEFGEVRELAKELGEEFSRGTRDP